MNFNADVASTHAGRSIVPRIRGVGTATPGSRYSQPDVLERFGIEDQRRRQVFLRNGIDSRSLVLPRREEAAAAPRETQAQLLDKHREIGLDIGERALLRCLHSIGAQPSDVQYLCCVTTTGLLTPGFSSLLIQRLGLRQDCLRLDVVGMGCNAGLNGFNAAVNWANANAGKLAILLCIEVCSAAYVDDEAIETAVVNSLFGDGAAALAVIADSADTHNGPRVCKFASQVIPEALDAMRFVWDQAQGKFHFRLHKDVPYVVGANAPTVIDRLLEGTGLRRRNIAHWLVHSGGRKVIDAISANLMLTSHDMRHTIDVLREHGNMSSGSFLFSYARLLDEGQVRPGDWGVMMTMGPGSSIETALLCW
ncbi:3,5-dihydroxyphenylacetyl-CoA synthase DpgA [Xanthomonas oryzae]|uniref:Acyltransferase n=1 Tax=Xanthomonas oryzae TaxID=347 RepID=K9MEM7_9XANT|nr:3,5-dihydroxyphenylacetyl-CoA synthase DpgA [Xanthomonas oryzae]AFV26073.1 acyltransferase [Xanthomonas oryzae]ALS94833.1 stilbene synthase [Xanthomonas oryzae pv. oryzae]AUI90622.1 type III polyketide synthase [Xanthomonas oryzae pv. oryzae]AUI94299.1 type III polyketide synthase [Xanthomonas oryzae pv. oryzae]AUI97968.1 type III polyketide synthase [Xanthomonas oryzae pv. oryzae]